MFYNYKSELETILGAFDSSNLTDTTIIFGIHDDLIDSESSDYYLQIFSTSRAFIEGNAYYKSERETLKYNLMCDDEDSDDSIILRNYTDIASEIDRLIVINNKSSTRNMDIVFEPSDLMPFTFPLLQFTCTRGPKSE